MIQSLVAVRNKVALSTNPCGQLFFNEVVLEVVQIYTNFN